MVGGTGRIAKA